MPRQRSPKRDLAYRLWLESDGKRKLKDIAAELEVSETQVRKWKNQDNWNGNVTNSAKGNVTKRNKKKAKAIAEEVNQVLENPELTDKQRLFCLYYIKSFNATKAYQKAYGVDYFTANAHGYEMLSNVVIRNEIQRLKQNRLNRELLDESDIFQKYMDIAFSDITDYVDFGTEEVPVMAMYGPVKIVDKETGEKKTLTKTVNVVRFKDGSAVDGTLISEVKQGRDGASIKLLDKQKALQWIAEHMDLATEEQRARVEKLKAETAQMGKEDESEEGVMIVNDAPRSEDI